MVFVYKMFSHASEEGMRMMASRIGVALVVALTFIGCRFGDPEVRHYQVIVEEVAESSSATESERVLGVEYLSANSAYDDQRIVYRKSPYRLDYYNYHRWTAAPSIMVTDVLREALQRSGEFAAVSSGYASGVDVLLKGRLLSIEEVDVSEDKWLARIALNLQLQDTVTGDVVWSRVITREQEVEERSPEGVARALSKALAKIVVEITPEIAGAPIAPRIPKRVPQKSTAPDAS